MKGLGLKVHEGSVVTPRLGDVKFARRGCMDFVVGVFKEGGPCWLVPAIMGI